MSTLASFPTMMERDRKREGLRVCRVAWLLGVTVREYREIEAGDRMPSPDTYERICKLYGWPQTFVETSGRPCYRWTRRTRDLSEQETERRH